jgi:enamine deaminase RidA (YjgF/YER057c/UK114 family)
VGEILRLHSGPRMSQAVAYGGLVFLAGQVDAQARDVAGQTRNILMKIDTLLEQAGSSRLRVLNANVWLTDIASFDDMNAVWEQWIDPVNSPARATVESKLAEAQYLVEIAVVAAR